MSRFLILLLALPAFAFCNCASAFARGMCKSEQQAKSPDGGLPTTITYTNDGTANALWIWLDKRGDRQMYRTLKPGESVRQPTFVGHLWIVANSNEDCELMIRADKGDVFKVVDEDVAAAKRDFAKRVGLPGDYVARWTRGPAACEKVGDQLSVSASGYTLGQTSCKFVEGPVLMQGGYQGISDCGGQKHEIRMTLSSGKLTMQGAGPALDHLSRCDVSTTGAATQTAFPRTYCATGEHGEVSRTPLELMPLLQKAFGINASLARDATYVRCVGPTMKGCFVGANLSCGKANQRRTVAGATAFCRSNPNTPVVPMVATGHDTIYDWSCHGQMAVAGKSIMAVDAQGYIASNWHEIR